MLRVLPCITVALQSTEDSLLILFRATSRRSITFKGHVYSSSIIVASEVKRYLVGGVKV